MMHNKSLFLSSLIIFAILLGVILIIGIFMSKNEEDSTLEMFSNIERVDNLLGNHSFEYELDAKKDWAVKLNSTNVFFRFDNIVKREGKFSLLLFSEDTITVSATIKQKIVNLIPDNKITLFGFLRTEDVDSVRFELHLIDKNDSTIIIGYSESLKGTNDWTELNTWIRTIEERSYSVIAKGILYGKGYAWFDNLRLYSLPIKQPFFQLPL